MENIVGFMSSEMRSELFKQDVLPQIKRALQE